MPQPNMKKEYRAELSLLRRNRRYLLRDWRAFVQGIRRDLRDITRTINKTERGARRSLARYDKRIAIVEGRLS
jgi:hypothetical protein